MNRLLRLRKRPVGPASGRKSRLSCRVASILTSVFLISKGIAQSTPSTTNLPGQAFPGLNADHSVTVRLKAPEAKKVLLEGGDGLVAQPLTLTKNSEGLWEATTPPAAPGFHYHWFNVDGLRVNDPGTQMYFGWGRKAPPTNGRPGGAVCLICSPAVPRVISLVPPPKNL